MEEKGPSCLLVACGLLCRRGRCLSVRAGERHGDLVRWIAALLVVMRRRIALRGVVCCMYGLLARLWWIVSHGYVSVCPVKKLTPLKVELAMRGPLGPCRARRGAWIVKTKSGLEILTPCGDEPVKLMFESVLVSCLLICRQVAWNKSRPLTDRHLSSVAFDVDYQQA